MIRLEQHRGLHGGKFVREIGDGGGHRSVDPVGPEPQIDETGGRVCARTSAKRNPTREHHEQKHLAWQDSIHGAAAIFAGSALAAERPANWSII